MEWVTTSTLLRDLRDYENHAAWQQLAERFRKPIVAFARGMGFAQIDAEDVAQETLIAFAEAFRKQQFDPSRGRLSNWMFGIAYRQALGHRRREGRQATPAADLGGATTLMGSVPDEQAASGIWDVEWEQALLRECLERVKTEVEPQTFEAFEHVVCLGKSPEEAAAAMQVPIKLVYNAKHRILKRVRELRAELEDLT